MNATREHFLADRRTSLGGSDIGAILGLSKFKSAVDVWLEKTGRAKDNFESTLPQRFGIFGEQFVAEEYTEKTGLKVVRYNKKLVHSEYPFITGNVDRLVIPAGQNIAHHMGNIRTDRGMEAKCVSAYAGGEWGDDESDDVPPYYFAQCGWYRILTGCHYWDLAALIGNHRFEVYETRRDQELEGLLLARAVEFWHNHVLADMPPPARSEADIAALFPCSEEGRKVAANDEIIRYVEDVKRKKAQLKELEAAMEASRLEVKKYMESAEALVLVDGDGKPLVTWKNNKDSKKIDYEAAFLEAVQEIKGLYEGGEPDSYAESMRQELIAKFTKQATGTRVFLTK